MNREMSSNDFRAEVNEKIADLPFEGQQFFAWLCAVRSLPFLSATPGFSYWEISKIHKHLQSVFYALDVSLAIVLSGPPCAAEDGVYTDTNDAAKDASVRIFTASSFANTDKAAIVSICIALDAATAIFRTPNTDCTYVDITAGNAAVSVFAYATACASYINEENLVLNYQKLIFDDIETIRSGQLYQLQHDTSLYGDLWQHFQGDLTAIGCGYWAGLYADLFANGFALDGKVLKSLKRRINVPADVREKGAAEVAVYLKRAETQGAVDVKRETRLVILGSAGAGKTTLARRLNGDPSYPAAGDSTHGVDTSITLDCKGITTHVWDFGGQVMYHASHQCFLSKDCVYILVVNARTEENRIGYWLDTIRFYSEDTAKVFIVINESDGRKQRVKDYDRFKEGEYAPFIREIYSFNVGADVDSVNSFKRELDMHIEAIGHQTFGKHDYSAMLEIQELFRKNQQVLAAADFEEILRNSEIESKADQEYTKTLFGTLGVAFHYDCMEGYVLDPEWISRGVYKIIDYLQACKFPFVKDSALDSIFAGDDAYSSKKRKYIFSLMEYYKIGFRNKGGIRGLIVPCAAAQFKPVDISIETDPNILTIRVDRDGLKEFPSHFFSRYIEMNKDDIRGSGEKYALWRTGMVLTGEGASALVELIENRRLEITVWGEKKDGYGKKLESRIDILLKEYRLVILKKIQENGVTLLNVIAAIAEMAGLFRR